jgi:hypothetical protein
MITDDLRQVRERLAAALTPTARLCPLGSRRILTAALRQVERIEAQAALDTAPPELAGLTFTAVATSFTEAGWIETDRAGYVPFGPADRRHGVRASWALDGHQVTVAALDRHGPRVTYDGDPVTSYDELAHAIEGDLAPLTELTALAELLLGTYDAGPPVAVLTHIAGQLRRHAIRTGHTSGDQLQCGRR